MPLTFPVTVLLFASARDRAGTDKVTVELAPAATVADLRSALANQFPSLAPLLTRCAIAVNHDFAPADRTLSTGDEVALIPPVSGG